MKILCVSLLRLGDLFHHLHILRVLRERHPFAEIHVLVFSEAAAARGLYPEFRFHVINRTELQRELVERHRTWRRAVQLLGEQIVGLNAMGFERIYNLTHTHFSARMMDLLSAKQKYGVRFENQTACLEGRELRYVNEVWSQESRPLLNWIEATAASVELPTPRLPSSPVRRREGEVWLQVLTSDQKKNWDIRRWRKLADLLRQQGQACRFICAPGEGPLLQTILGEDWALQVEEMSFLQMRERKQECTLLIAGDTSVLHFATLEGVPVMGIYVGSANPFKTPPWQQGARIWWAQVACSPCGHRSECSQTRHLCGDQLQPEGIAASVKALLKQTEFVDSFHGEAVHFGEIDSLGRLKLRRDHVERSRRAFTESLASA